MEYISHAEFIEILITLRAIWSSIRKAIHEVDYRSPAPIHSFLRSLVAELDTVQEEEGTRQSVAAHVDVVLNWIPPLAEFVKYSINGGSAKTQRKGDSVVVCRDHQGTYMGSSARVFINITDPL